MTRFGRPQGEDEQHATALELFYDLVFVFAVTQISHHLLGHLTWTGAGQSALLLLVVWWSWNYTTWVTNELAPESPVVRLLMIALMLASLMMAVAIPHAFEEDALLFVGCYLAIQVGRHTFLTFAAADPARAPPVPALRRARPRRAGARAGRRDPGVVRLRRRLLAGRRAGRRRR